MSGPSCTNSHRRPPASDPSVRALPPYTPASPSSAKAIPPPSSALLAPPVVSLGPLVGRLAEDRARLELKTRLKLPNQLRVWLDPGLLLLPPPLCRHLEAPGRGSRSV